MVLVTLDSQGAAATHVAPISLAEACEGALQGTFDTSFLTVNHAEVSEAQSGGRDIRINFRSTESFCVPKTLVLRPEDFRSGPIEVRGRAYAKPTRSIIQPH